MTLNPGRSERLYEVAELAGQAYAKTFSPRNILSNFKATEFYPVRPEIFSVEMFLPSLVTDVPITHCSKDSPTAYQ